MAGRMYDTVFVPLITVKTCCFHVPSAVPTSGQVPFNDYKAYCIGIGRKPVGRSTFYEQMVNKGKKKHRSRNKSVFDVALFLDGQPHVVSG